MEQKKFAQIYEPNADILLITFLTLVVTFLASYLDFSKWMVEWSPKLIQWNMDKLLAAFIFLLAALTVRSAIIRHKLKKELKKTMLVERELYQQLDEKIALLKEINHRVKNNLSLVRSLTFLKSKSITNPQARQALEELESQIMAISASHELLSFDNKKNIVDLQDYLVKVGQGVIDGCGRANDITLTFDVKSIKVHQKIGIYVGLIFTELLLNSVKHAFPNGKKGNIHLEIITKFDNIIQIMVSDNGPGYRGITNLNQKSSIGLGLIQEIVEKQLSGKVDYMTCEGFTTKLTIPMAA